MSSHSWRFYHRQSVFFSCETVWYSTKIEGISIEALVSCHGNPLTCMKHFTLAPHASKGPMPTTLSSTNFFGTGKKPRSSFPAKALLLYSLYIKPASLFFVPFFLPFSKLLQLSYATFKRFWCFATKQYTISLCAYFSISKASPPPWEHSAVLVSLIGRRCAVSRKAWSNWKWIGYLALRT